MTLSPGGPLRAHGRGRRRHCLGQHGGGGAVRWRSARAWAAACSQSTTDPRLREALLDAMAGGLAAGDALAALVDRTARHRHTGSWRPSTRAGRSASLLRRSGAARGDGRLRRGCRRRRQPAGRSGRARGDARRLPGPARRQRWRPAHRRHSGRPGRGRRGLPGAVGRDGHRRVGAMAGHRPPGRLARRSGCGSSPGSGRSGSPRRSPTSSAHCARPKWPADARPDSAASTPQSRGRDLPGRDGQAQPTRANFVLTWCYRRR